MTIQDIFEVINAEKPKGMSLSKYMIKHPKRIHSQSTLIAVAKNLKQCKKQKRMPSNIVLSCLSNYFKIGNIYEDPELLEADNDLE